MPPQKSSSGTSADPATQSAPPGPPPASPPSQPGTPPTQPGDPSTPPGTSPAAPQTGTWFQPGDPQILIQWTLTQTAPPPSAPPPDAGSGTLPYKAQVRIYQQIFDTEFPALPLRGSVVPFSVVDPSVSTAPYLQGSFVLLQSPLTLEVVNLRFPGFQTQNLTLYSAPPATPPTAPPADGSSTDSGTSPSDTAPAAPPAAPPATGTAEGESPAA